MARCKGSARVSCVIASPAQTFAISPKRLLMDSHLSEKRCTEVKFAVASTRDACATHSARVKWEFFEARTCLPFPPRQQSPAPPCANHQSAAPKIRAAPLLHFLAYGGGEVGPQ